MLRAVLRALAAFVFWHAPVAAPDAPALPLLLETGSVVRTEALHVGIRPASDALGDYAVTIQVSASWLTL